MPTARLPQLSADGKLLRFCATVEPPEELYTHGTCSTLCSIDATAIAGALAGPASAALPVATLIDTVDEVTEDGGFPGLWGGTGAGLSWHDLADEGGLLINSAAFGVDTIWYLPADAESGTHPQRLATQASVMAAQGAVHGGEIIALVQSPVRPPTLCSAPLSALLRECSSAGPFDDTSSVWQPFWGDTDQAGWSSASWQQASLSPPTRIYPANTAGEVVHYISVLPSILTAASPAVIFPHGGPHSVTTSAFAPSAAFFVQLGYSVHLVNYRGSLSFGQASVKALKGRCGDIDVADTAQVAEDIVAKGMADHARLFFLGGSHSGFIGAHLAGQ